MLKFWSRYLVLSDSSFVRRALPPIEKLVNVNDADGETWHTYMLRLFKVVGVQRSNCFINHNNIHAFITKLKQLYCCAWSKVIKLPAKGDPLARPKLRTYTSFKESFAFEPYLMLPKFLRREFTKLRISNHCLAIEKGRWSDIELDQRVCHRCHANTVDDEFHFLLKCPALNIPRSDFLARIKETWGFIPLLDQTTFKVLMSARDPELMAITCTYVKIAFDLFSYLENFTKFIDVTCYFKT